uniref:CCHC-type domain-containing protein n=1 Tax=Tanacetum cinerariifolium TaxID=118510 RepID=A0A6L2N613_TANCI|nr:hypothetical protein [Tanacetum cinerariifolium]
MDKIICDLNKTPDLSQRPPQNCAKCGNPVDGHYCQGCDLLRKKFKKDLFTYCIENGIFQDFHDTSEPSNDNTNVVNAPKEPFLVKQDLGKNSSQSPPHINHHCCYGCGDSLEDIFFHQCTCESCGKGAHYGYNCPSKVPFIPNSEHCNNQTIDELPQTLPSFDPTCYSGDENSFTYDSKSNIIDDSPNVFNPSPKPPDIFIRVLLHNDVQNIHEELVVYINTPSWDRHTICYNDDDDKDCTIAITPILSTEEYGDEHLNTISATESDEVINSSVENLVPIPSESEGIPDIMCDVPFHDNSPSLDISKDQFDDFFDSNDDSTSIDDDSFYIDDIEYVEASPPDSELVSLEVMEIVIPEVGWIEENILLTIKDDILREKLLNINLFIANIEALKDNPTPYSDFMTKSSSTSLNFLLEETNTFGNSLPEFETFCFDSKENSSGSTTTRADISLPDYEAFYDDHVKEISSGKFKGARFIVDGLGLELLRKHIGCALLRKKFKKDLFTYCIEIGIFQDFHDTSEPSNDNTNIVNAPKEPFLVKQDPCKNSSQSPLHINHHCCYGCGDSLEDIFCHQCTCESCGKATESDEVIKSSVENLVPILSESEGIPDNMCDVPFHDNSLSLDISKDQFKDFSYSNDDSTSIDDDSFSIDDIEYVEASPLDSELVSLEAMGIVIPEVGGIEEDNLLTIKDDILREKLLNINLLIANIEALKDNPTPYSDFMTKSSSTSLKFLLEETNTFGNSLPEYETFCFDSKENSSGSTTTRADISLPDYEAFYDDHVKEISSGSTTTHSDFSLYDSFIFDLSINPFPPADRSDFYEFADVLSHIISPSEYDCFSFKNEPNSGDFTMDVVEDTFPTIKLRVHVLNVLPTHPTLQLNLDFILSSESLFLMLYGSFFLFSHI